MIYADNAATTKLDKDALEAMIPWLQDEYGNASQPYSFSRKPKKALAEARALIASCIGHSQKKFFLRQVERKVITGQSKDCYSMEIFVIL